jgi:hypothetical protein
MVDRPRFPIRSKYALKPAISSALSTNPPEGFLAPPALIDQETIGKTDLKLREQQYVRSYTKLTSRDWNDYVQLGIQQFASPNLYQIHVAKESTDEKSLRLARYFRFHLENKAEVLPLLLKTIASVEQMLANTHGNRQNANHTACCVDFCLSRHLQAWAVSFILCRSKGAHGVLDLINRMKVDVNNVTRPYLTNN